MEKSVNVGLLIIRRGFPRHATIFVIINFFNLFLQKNWDRSVNFAWQSTFIGQSNSARHFT